MKLEIKVPDGEMVDLFAEAIGDKNPLHVDDNFARRTRFRGRIVHGVHLLVRAVDAVFTEPSQIDHISARFLNPVEVGEIETISLNANKMDGLLEIVARDGEKDIFTASVEYRPESRDKEQGLGGVSDKLTLDEHTGLSELENYSGTLGYGLDIKKMMAALKGTRHIHYQDVLAIGMVSTVVGMKVPGKYASLVSLDVEIVVGEGAGAVIDFRVDRVSTATRMLRVSLSPNGKRTGAEGTVTTMIMQPQIERETVMPLPRDGLVNGKSILVVGASGGIGSGIASLLVREGALVTATYYKGSDDIENLAEKEKLEGGKIEATQLDIRDETSCQRVIQELVKRNGKLDGIVYSAVHGANAKSFKETQAKDFIKQFEISVIGLRNIISASLDHLATSQGSVVALSSSITDAPVSKFSSYITGKSGMEGLVRGLAVEYAPLGIRFNLICPGFVLTDLNATATRADVEAITKEYPIGRLAKVDDVARLVVVAVSDLNSYSTGQKYRLNGGKVPFN